MLSDWKEKLKSNYNVAVTFQVLLMPGRLRVWLKKRCNRSLQYALCSSLMQLSGLSWVRSDLHNVCEGGFVPLDQKVLILNLVLFLRYSLRFEDVGGILPPHSCWVNNIVKNIVQKKVYITKEFICILVMCDSFILFSLKKAVIPKLYVNVMFLMKFGHLT